MLSWIKLFGASPIKPEFWLEKAGKSAIYVVVAIIFAESGLFFGFFFPGDSLLFLTGFLTSNAAKTFAVQNHLEQVVAHIPPLPVVCIVLFLAAVAGDQVGYLFGRKVGPALFTRPNSRFFKQEHVTRAHDFLEKNGPKTILLARFVPIVRTFTPIVAGVGRMRYRTFVTFNLIGGFAWAVGVTVLGALLGKIEFVRKNIEYTIVAVILISLIPVFIEVYKSRKHKRADSPVG
ncbi:MAG: rane protein [Acidimicrobiales bacterium]|nr:rane protein [Acidimicrobiales bacterium]